MDPGTLTQDPGWEEFVSYEGRFRVLTPGDFSVKIDSVSTAIGTLAYHTFYYQPPEADRPENLFYMISYCDYPPEGVHSDSTALLDEFFASTMDAAAESVQGELLYSAEQKLDGYPGRIWRIDYLQGQAVVKTRAFLVKNRYYAIQTITVESLAMNPASERFFDSFRLLE